jgi:hypothetical protein
MARSSRTSTRRRPNRSRSGATLQRKSSTNWRSSSSNSRSGRSRSRLIIHSRGKRSKILHARIREKR